MIKTCTSQMFDANDCSIQMQTPSTWIPQYNLKRNCHTLQSKNVQKNIFSLTSVENKNIQPGPEKQYSYIKKSVIKI